MSVRVDEEVDWHTLPAAQQPHYEDERLLAKVLARIHRTGPLVPESECADLTAQMAAAGRGEAFVASGGNCADTLDAPASTYELLVRIVLQITVIIMWIARVPVVKLLRVGSWGKPRSNATEIVDGNVELDVWRGDAVNGLAQTPEARRHNAGRLWLCYTATKTILDQVHRLTLGGTASLENIHRWNLEFVRHSPQGKRYAKVTDAIQHILDFLRVTGLKPGKLLELRVADTYVGHEGLILKWLEALTFDGWYLGGHFVWIGERTRDLLGAHVAFFRTLKNPVGVKLGPKTTPEEVKLYCQILNPKNVPGKLTFITRLGADNTGVLIELVRAAAEIGCPVTWICDAVHGNTITVGRGRKKFKTRRMGAMKRELQGFFDTFTQAQAEGLNVWPGGFMLELTGQADVYECLGGHDRITAAHFETGYETACDPRLNARQALEMAFFVARLRRQFQLQVVGNTENQDTRTAA